MARISLEEAPPTRGRMPAHPKNRDKDTAAYDAYQQWQADQQVRKKQNEEAAKIYLEEKAKRNEEASKELNRKKDVVMSHLIDSAESLPITAQEYKEEQDNKRQKALNEASSYKNLIRSLATGAELTFAGGTLLGAYANYKKWKDLANLANATKWQLTKAKLANLLDKNQAVFQRNGVLVDAYQTYDANTKNDDFNVYYNLGSGILGTAGYIGAKDYFRGLYPRIDRALDLMGIMQSGADFVKFGYDKIVNNNE